MISRLIALTACLVLTALPTLAANPKGTTKPSGAKPAPAPASEAAPLPPLNAKVLEFAAAHRGQKVGDGECAALAMQALRAAGAVRRPPFGPDADYVWGDEISAPGDALPGDVLQFRNAEFRGKKALPGGGVYRWTQSYPHHTAIVAGVGPDGKSFTVLQQNVGEPTTSDAARKIVQEGTITLDALQKGGSVRIFRPVPPGN